MAHLIKGVHKGMKVTVHQCCNDWFSVIGYDERHKTRKDLVVSPSHIMLTYDEYYDHKEQVMKGNVGTMMEEFDYRFIDLKGFPGVTFIRRRK